MLIVISVILIITLALIAVVLFHLGTLGQTIQSLKESRAGLDEKINQQNLSVQEIKDLLGAGSKGQDLLRSHLQDTMKAVDAIRLSHDERRKLEEESRQSIRRLEEVIAGTKTKGMAGENILREVFRSFPADMVVSHVKIGSKEVEFGMVLANKKIVPIDVKWTTTRLLEELAKETDEVRQDRLRSDIENEVNRRVAEISQYIDPNLTMPWAVGAVPDSVFAILKRAHLDAYKRNVIIISYSMTVPYLLTLFMLHRQFAGSVDIENLKTHLSSVRHHLVKMAEVLDNKVCRANSMLSNAINDYRQMLGSIQSSINLLETSGKTRKEVEVK